MEAETKLADIVRARSDEIVDLWEHGVRKTLGADAMDEPILRDHMPLYLEEVARSLEVDHCVEACPPGRLTTSNRHGIERFHLGFDVTSVMREYGMLRDAILSVAVSAGHTVTTSEYAVLSACVTNGAVEAVAEYTKQRDVEMRRQAAKHLGFLAHELRNPIASARLALDALKRQPGLEGSRLLGIALRNLERLSEEIDRALIEVKITAGTPDLAIVDVRALAAELLDEVEEDAAARSLSLRLVASGPVNAYVDRRLIASALSNLLRNALKFSRAGGHVTVRCRRADGHALVEVEDECGGLPEGTVEKLFDPFVQLGKDRSGFGLGLAITKQAVDAHVGATVRVLNEPPRGCAFVLELPATRES